MRDIRNGVDETMMEIMRTEIVATHIRFHSLDYIRIMFDDTLIWSNITGRILMHCSPGRQAFLEDVFQKQLEKGAK